MKEIRNKIQRLGEIIIVGELIWLEYMAKLSTTLVVVSVLIMAIGISMIEANTKNKDGE